MIRLTDRHTQRINEASSYFGDAFGNMILDAIEEGTKNLSKKDIGLLNESILVVSNKKKVLEEAINHSTIMVNEFKDEIAPVSFMNRLKEIAPTYMSNYNITITEDTEPEEQEPEQKPSANIEGDGEVIDGAPSSEQEGVEGEEEVPLTPEQNLQLELAKTDEKFVTVVLYDKIVDILGSIKTIKENMSSSKSETELDMYLTLEKYEAYLEILNELIFVMDINTIYYNVVNIIIEVNDLLNKYLISTKVKIINNNESSKEEKALAAEDLKTNNDDAEETNDEVNEQ